MFSMEKTWEVNIIHKTINKINTVEAIRFHPQWDVCVFTGLRAGQYDQIMRWWISTPQSEMATALDSVAYCYVLIPRLP